MLFLGFDYYKRTGDLHSALTLMERVLEMQGHAVHTKSVASAYGNLGVICEQRGDVAGASELWTKARDFFAKIGMPHMVKKVQGWIDGL